MVDIIECDQYHYQKYSKLLHFGGKVVISNPIEPYRYSDVLVYFNRQVPYVSLIADEDMEIVLYNNRDLIQKIATPKSFIVSAIFEKTLLFNQHFDNQMDFNQWCFDNDLTHKLLKKQVQIYVYFAPFTSHPITGELCIPPILLAKSHPDLNLSSSMAEMTSLNPIHIPVKKGQGIHFDKHHYQCQLPANVRFLEVADDC